MKLHDLRPAEGSRKERTRVGRGIAAGKGKTAGRGTKGQKARAGGSIPPWFEGGQTPLHVRIPKLRGFKNRFKLQYEVVNVGAIAAAVERGAFETEAPTGAKGKSKAQITVNQDILRAVGLVRSLDKPLKILGAGELGSRRCSSSPMRSPVRHGRRSRQPAARSRSSRSRRSRSRRSGWTRPRRRRPRPSRRRRRRPRSGQKPRPTRSPPTRSPRTKTARTTSPPTTSSPTSRPPTRRPPTKRSLARKRPSPRTSRPRRATHPKRLPNQRTPTPQPIRTRPTTTLDNPCSNRC